MIIDALKKNKIISMFLNMFEMYVPITLKPITEIKIILLIILYISINSLRAQFNYTYLTHDII